MTTALEGSEGSAACPGRTIPPGKTWYPLYKRLNGPQGRSGQVLKISPPTGIRSPDRPARSQSLYRLSYRAHCHVCTIHKKLMKVCFQSETYTEKNTTPVGFFLAALVSLYNFPPMPFISLIASTNTWMHLLMTLYEKGKNLFILMVFYELPHKSGALLTLFIPCRLIELNCSYMTPTNATFTHTNIVFFFF